MNSVNENKIFSDIWQHGLQPRASWRLRPPAGATGKRNENRRRGKGADSNRPRKRKGRQTRKKARTYGRGDTAAVRPGRGRPSRPKGSPHFPHEAPFCVPPPRSAFFAWQTENGREDRQNPHGRLVCIGSGSDRRLRRGRLFVRFRPPAAGPVLTARERKRNRVLLRAPQASPQGSGRSRRRSLCPGRQGR